MDKKLKVGILTYHSAHNYGAVLQCYALQEYLKSLGHEVVVVDYRPKYFHYGLFVWYNWLSANPVKMVKKLMFQCKIFKTQKKRIDAFVSFIRKRLNLMSLNLNASQDDIDCFVFGSDQIWGKHKGLFDPIYFGDFKAAKGHKLISYAASASLKSLTADEMKKVSNWLKSFSAIMVREQSLQSLLSPLTEKNVSIVIDPTLLLSSTQWNNIAVPPGKERPYLLIYQMRSNLLVYQISKAMADKHGLQIVELVTSIDDVNRPYKTVNTASPEEFVGWLCDASFVVTNSFHGTAFSLIYKKKFVSVKQNEISDLRISSLLTIANVRNRFIGSFDELDTHYVTTEVQIDMDEVIGESKERLRNSLVHIMNKKNII